MAGIKEVAEEAGVSTATVSRALRGLHHVNPGTRSKIIARTIAAAIPNETALFVSSSRPIRDLEGFARDSRLFTFHHQNKKASN